MAMIGPARAQTQPAARVALIGWGNADYGAVGQARFVSNMLAILTFVPVLMTWSVKRPPPSEGGEARLAEVGGLLAGLLAASSVVFDSTFSEGAAASLMYLPMPFLIWTALRFGPSMSSGSYAIVAFVVIWRTPLEVRFKITRMMKDFGYADCKLAEVVHAEAGIFDLGIREVG